MPGRETHPSVIPDVAAREKRSVGVASIEREGQTR